LRDQPLDRGDLRVEELDLADAAVDRLALLERQLERAQPFAALLLLPWVTVSGSER
jgi:hypothetical protein